MQKINFPKHLLLVMGVVVALIIFIIWGYQTFYKHSADIIDKELLGPFEHGKGYCWIVEIPEFYWGADTSMQPENSTLMLYENGCALGPAHSLIDIVQKVGQGRFSHWRGRLYFSTSDNSDPNDNGRNYSIKVSASALHRPAGRIIIFAILGLALTGAVAGLFLMALFSHSSVIRRWLYLVTIINCLLILILYENIIPLLSWLGKIVHIFIFIYLLITFTSLFLISYEVISKGLSGRKKTAFKIITVWGVIGIFLLLFEVFFRIFPIYNTLALNPGIKFFWPDYVYYPLNNMGYRDRAFEPEKNSQTYRIMMVGDSFTEGAGCPRRGTFSGILEQTLNRRLRASDCSGQVEVYNLGRCGANTTEEVQLILRESPVLKPDLIIMAYVLNDPEVHPPDIKSFAPPPWVAAIHKIFLEEIHSYAYYWMFTNFTLFHGPVSTGGDYCLAIHNPDYHGWKKAKAAVSALSKFVRENNMDMVTVIFPIFNFDNYPSRYRDLHQQVAQMMQARDIETIDLLDFYEGINKNLREFTFSSYDSHPNSLAHKLLGQYLADSVWERRSFKRIRETCSSN